MVSPHAGYMYSGPIAAHGYYVCSQMKGIELVVILGPNHWGLGSGVATVKAGVWRTPLGDVEVDADAAKDLVQSSKIVDFSEDAHLREHSIEVQLPFLQFIYGAGFKLLPICMLMQDKRTASEVADALLSVIEKRKALLVASSDFTHYEDHRSASEKDRRLIESILGLDIDGLYDTLERLNVSACGYGPIAVVMNVVKRLGCKEGRLLKYATSGDVTGDYGAVVGYASIIFVLRESS